MPKQLVIDRSIWLHGEGVEDSMLLRPSDGKMCCIGIYLHTVCGVPKEELREVRMPGAAVPVEAQWLHNVVEGGYVVTANKVGTELAEVNDWGTIDQTWRERKVTALFRDFGGIDVTFIGGSSPNPMHLESTDGIAKE